ncbi:DUF2163 domain-containing protein [Methyloceanibacter caenitepidi]|uniref:Gene transfer agent FAD/FMN-containing dehydrogenase n=1 Tax=Methyloceanibacter caenitepidi TaxID=1384459 RepID=A0A0A8K5E4_9HYPH|nr:DUF2163 domain-containing protein [Methyloceanibacter caenitepidi]BAQ17991.1 gene transfer agent FAD/FMN-containing dehydrogenase [Methyloceanibacter caenitepidi]
MRAISSALQDHLDSGATTLCWCWRITRNDAVSFGFTDHDRDLEFGGTLYEAASGFTGSEIASAVGLNVDTLDVDGALKSDRLNEADLAAGLFDNAAIEIYRVNWADPDHRVLMRTGNLGEVSRGAHHFRCEVRGLAHALQQPKGRIIQYGCDADLGDARCKIDLDQAAFSADGTVASLDASPRRFTASGLEAHASNWFTRGLLTWESGANDGRTSEVKLHAKASSGVTIELWQRPSEAIAAGDGFKVQAGCDKQFGTCRAKFSNTANFRGFPHVPGNDFMLRVVSRSDKNDGGRVR